MISDKNENFTCYMFIDVNISILTSTNSPGIYPRFFLLILFEPKIKISNFLVLINLFQSSTKVFIYVIDCHTWFWWIYHTTNRWPTIMISVILIIDNNLKIYWKRIIYCDSKTILIHKFISPNFVWKVFVYMRKTYFTF